jgi:phage terminase large subunit
MLIKLPHNFTPRQHQSAQLKAIFRDGYKHIYSIIHRRAGKTKGAVNNQVTYALKNVGLHFYLMPQSNQVRKVIWTGRGSDGVKFIDHIPPECVKHTNNIEMFKELTNGSIIQFVGSNNYDALVGTNPLSITYDEYALQTPMARELLAPILLENGGVEFIYTTPRGHNHAYELYQMAINNPAWFVQKLTIEDTFRSDGSRIITLDQIEEERRSGKSEELLEQEYYCSFDIGNQGAYFTKEIAHAEYEQRILDFNINPNLPVHTSWDIGVRDSTAICLFQQSGVYIDYIGYIEGNNKGLQDYYKELHDLKTMLGFKKWGYHFAPHDIKNREWGSSARSRLQIAADMGLHFMIVPDLSVQDRIEAGRSFIREVRFHKTHCKQLIRCLREAMREYDELAKVFKDKPLHNWALHGFDAYTYGAVAWRHQFSRPELNQIRTYQITGV